MRAESLISIHAPRVGSDSPTPTWLAGLSAFQSTLPVWGATVHDVTLWHPLQISIHAPRVGSDMRKSIACPSRCRISIHAPRVGSDPTQDFRIRQIINFNPRSPCGERHAAAIRSFGLQLISIHAPRVGSDMRKCQNQKSDQAFQSTLPVWGATTVICSRTCPLRFQSTLPVWGATALNGYVQSGSGLISIHAPRVGSDSKDA